MEFDSFNKKCNILPIRVKKHTYVDVNTFRYARIEIEKRSFSYSVRLPAP